METKTLGQTEVQRMLTMAKAEKSYSSIANFFNKEGFKTTRGKPITKGTVSAVLIDAGFQKRFIKNKGTRKPYAVAKTGTFSKWDVLKCIEGCHEFPPNTKKAIIALILQELYS